MPIMKATKTLRIPCTLMRGGTSRGLVFRRDDLPDDRAGWELIFLAALGSPDPRQLDGVGAGDSHTSKVAVVNPCEEDVAELDYLFGEVSLTEARVDYAGNSGNIISALGLYAVEEGWVPARSPETRVRVRNLNTGKIAELSVPVKDGRPLEEGDFSIDGVPGSAPRIDMLFPRPEGAVTGRLLPNGEARTVLRVPGMGDFEVTMLDAANPVVLARGEDFGISPQITPQELNADEDTLERIQLLRSAGSMAMGLVERPEQAWCYSNMIPFPVLLFPPVDYPCFGNPNRIIRAEESDFCVRVISLGMAHKSINVTVSVALTAAALTPGTLAHDWRPHDWTAVPSGGGSAPGNELRIGHPSGVMHTQGKAGVTGADGAPVIEWVRLGRTARRIMEGAVLIQPHKLNWLRSLR